MGPEINMDIEQSLRAALRPVDPNADFAAGVMARIVVEQHARRRRARWQMPLALAASLVVATIGLKIVMQQREAQRIESARAQLALALEITSSQLNQLQQKLNRNTPTENGI
jgi:hypothetical protein